MIVTSASIGHERPERWRPALEANMGGPASRSRTEKIDSSLLGKDGGPIRCPCMIRIGLSFADGVDPVSVMTELIAEEGYGSPEDLREDFAVPDSPLICRPLADGEARLAVGPRSPRRSVIEQALLLALCSATLFDPARPVLWTQASLTRGLELFDPKGFYA